MAIKKKTFSELKEKYSKKASFKKDRFLDLGEAFLDATGVPGPALGHLNMFLGHTDTGKAQPLTSNILTPTGWVKMGEIKVGNLVIGSDGNEQYVLGVYPQGERPVYKVTFSDKSEVMCDEEHLWSVNEYKDRHNGILDSSFKTMKLSDMKNNFKYSIGKNEYKNYKLPKLSPVSFDSKKLKINSYVLGCFISNGLFEKSNDVVKIITKDFDIISEIENSEHFINNKLKNRIFNDTIIQELNVITLTNDIKQSLLEYSLIGKLNEKFIPEDYIYKASIEDRIALLQGLMDTNGIVDKGSGNVYYTTTSKELSDNIIELVNSLGGISIPTYSYKGEENESKQVYVQSIRLPENIKPFRLNRKLLYYKFYDNVDRYIENIEFSHNEKCQCIKVSNSNCLYVTDNFVLTHNTTALVKSAVDAQKKGILPVFIITEQKWDFPHAKLMGLEVEETVDEETGEIVYDGDFFFNNGFEYIEQITDFINELLDAQDRGEIERDLLFLWDSVGSIPCKMTKEGKGGKQHNAAALADKIGMGINQRITGSRRAEKPYTNTLVIVNQPWVELPDNPFGQPKIKAKGGEAIWLNSTLVFLFGNQKNAGTGKYTITKDKRKIKIATRTKISIMKNHVNGSGYEDGKILVTAHDFMAGKDAAEEKKSIEIYKKEHGDYFSNRLGISPDEVGSLEATIDIDDEM